MRLHSLRLQYVYACVWVFVCVRTSVSVSAISVNAFLRYHWTLRARRTWPTETAKPKSYACTYDVRKSVCEEKPFRDTHTHTHILAIWEKYPAATALIARIKAVVLFYRRFSIHFIYFSFCYWSVRISHRPTNQNNINETHAESIAIEYKKKTVKKHPAIPDSIWTLQWVAQPQTHTIFTSTMPK